MIDPYRMVVVNIILSLLLAMGILIYTKILKRKINYLYLLIIISLLPLISILRKGSYQSGDLSLHAKFAMQFFENLQQGNIIPSWIQRHCSGYGCPVYSFLFLLPYYLISFFHFIGFSFVSSVKMLIAISYIASGISMYYWIKDEIDEKSAFVASIFYLFTPYHLIDLHFRVSIGELLSMVFLPMQFLFVKKYIESKKPVFMLANTLTYALLILSHQVTSFLTFPMSILYGVIVWMRHRKKTFSQLIGIFSTFVWGILLTAFVWIPQISEVKYTQNDNSIGFHPITSYLYSPNRYGLLFQGHYGEFYFNVGYVQWIVIILSFFVLIKRSYKGKHIVLLWYSSLLFLGFFLMMQSFSRPIWDLFPFLKNFQFSWRLLIEIMFVVSIMAAIMIKIFKSKMFFVLLCSITILYTILNWGNRKAEPTLTDTVLSKQTLFKEEPGGVDFTTPKWVDKYQPWIGGTPVTQIDILSGDAEIQKIHHEIVHHEYIIDAKTPVIIKDNTFYFPGWDLRVNNTSTPINYKNKSYPGVITFSLPKGIYLIDIRFIDTFDKTLGKVISLISFVFLSIYFGWYTRRNKKSRLF